jgi:aspartyl-tRNA(Asn)/glutamyl-tRNA(Gln) amidotransferase subunit C
MASITSAEVKKIALLSRLELSDGEIEKFREQLGDILGYIEKLSEVDIDGVEEFINAASGGNVFREDTPHESLPTEKALQNAPLQGGGFFKVPQTI